MKEFMLIYQGGDSSWMTRSREEVDAAMKRWDRWFRGLEASGHLVGAGAALSPGGVMLRRNGDTVVTDAPLAEVKELIGGYSVIRAESLEAAGEIAAGCPLLERSPDGRVVVRPVYTPER